MGEDTGATPLRPSARILLLDRQDRVLLFRFAFEWGALAGQSYWATPGGALEDGESYEDAARRELLEETGIAIGDPGPRIAYREFVLRLPDGRDVLAQEAFYLVSHQGEELSRRGWTDLEAKVMVDHRWWPADELLATSEIFFPENLVDILRSVGVSL